MEVLPRTKETAPGETKKVKRAGLHSPEPKESHGARADYYKGPGLVDRVPARPPDRRFQEKSRQSERPARTWGQSRTEQKAKSKTPDSTNERVKSERSQNERLPKARQKSLNESPLKEKVAQDRQPQGKPEAGRPRQERAPQGRSQSRPAKPPAPGASQHYPRQDRGTGPRPQEQQRGGPSNQAPLQGMVSQRLPQGLPERVNRPRELLAEIKSGPSNDRLHLPLVRQDCVPIRLALKTCPAS